MNFWVVTGSTSIQVFGFMSFLQIGQFDRGVGGERRLQPNVAWHRTEVSKTFF
jgi:hypothetical protein